MFKLLTHISLKHFVKKMTQQQLHVLLSSYTSCSNRIRHNNDIPLSTLLGYLKILKKYCIKEVARRDKKVKSKKA